MKQSWVYSACLLMTFVYLSLVPVTNSWPSHHAVKTLSIVSGSLSSQALSEWYQSLKLFWTIHQHLLSMRPWEDVVVQLLSHIWLFVISWTAACRPFCPSPSSWLWLSSCPLNWWCHQPSHPLLSPCPPALSLSQQQGLFQWVHSLHQVAKILEHQLKHQSFQWVFRFDFL